MKNHVHQLQLNKKEMPSLSQLWKSMTKLHLLNSWKMLLTKLVVHSKWPLREMPLHFTVNLEFKMTLYLNIKNRNCKAVWIDKQIQQNWNYISYILLNRNSEYLKHVGAIEIKKKTYLASNLV